MDDALTGAARSALGKDSWIAAFFGALAVFAYIVSVALTKSPAGPLALVAS